MSKLTIVANIHANPDKVDLVKTELEKLIPTTRAETGCIQYDLHQDNTDPAHFMFFEIWESRDLWQEHMEALPTWRPTYRLPKVRLPILSSTK